MNDKKRSLRVFLCHASGDKPAVIKLYERLIKDGVDAWLDKEKLIPGQDWQIEIPKAVKNSDIVIVCISSQSVTKEGFVQKEIRFALDVAEEKPEGAIFIIPVRLENCTVPNRIDRYQWVDLFLDDGYEKLFIALITRASELGVEFPKNSNSNILSKKEHSNQLPELSYQPKAKKISTESTIKVSVKDRFEILLQNLFNNTKGVYSIVLIDLLEAELIISYPQEESKDYEYLYILGHRMLGVFKSQEQDLRKNTRLKGLEFITNENLRISTYIITPEIGLCIVGDLKKYSGLSEKILEKIKEEIISQLTRMGFSVSL